MTPQENIPLDFTLKRYPESQVRGLYRGQSFWDRTRNAYDPADVVGWHYVKPMAEPEKSNPWDLSERQLQTLDALAKYGSAKLAGRALFIDHKTVERRLADAKKKMGAAHKTGALLAYDRWARSQEAA